MLKDIPLFHNDEFGDVHTIIINGVPWHVAKDVHAFGIITIHKKAICDHVHEEDGTVNKSENMEKLVTNNGNAIRRKRLFQWLRDFGVLIRSSNPRRNLPHQEYLERRYFKAREKCFVYHGKYRLYYQTMVTRKGKLWIIGRLRNEYLPEMNPLEP